MSNTDELNTGHGHVRPRPDGVKARCGGPAICSACKAELTAHYVRTGVHGPVEDVAQQPAASGEPVAYMWQHDETGRTGFVDAWQLQNGWRENNPRLHVVAPLYAAPQPAPARVPLTEDALQLMALEAETPAWGEWWTDEDALLRFARAIEAAHNIAAAPTAQQEPKP